jgi:hypothetical protein
MEDKKSIQQSAHISKEFNIWLGFRRFGKPSFAKNGLVWGMVRKWSVARIKHQTGGLPTTNQFPCPPTVSTNFGWFWYLGRIANGLKTQFIGCRSLAGGFSPRCSIFAPRVIFHAEASPGLAGQVFRRMGWFGEWCANGALSGLNTKKRVAKYNPDFHARQQAPYEKMGGFGNTDR